jgi:O-antigen/teichoic acid export membrane protein
MPRRSHRGSGERLARDGALPFLRGGEAVSMTQDGSSAEAGLDPVATSTVEIAVAEAAEEAGEREDERLSGITDLRRHTARGMLVNSAFEVGLVVLSALRGVLAAAFVTRADYGIWGLLGLTMWTALGLKAQFGASDKYIQQSEDNQEHAFQRAFTIELIFMAAATPLATAVVVAFALLTGNSVVLAPGLVLLLLLPAAALQFPTITFYRRMDYLKQRKLTSVDPVVGAIVTIGLAAAGAGYWSFVVGLLAGAWAGAAVALFQCPYRLALRYDRGSLRQYVQFSAPLLVGGLAILALYQVIFLVGGRAIGLAGLGTFTLAGNLMQYTDQADQIVTATLYPAICAVRDRVSLLSEIFVKSNRLSLMWAVPFGTGLSLFGSDLARFVLGARWLPAVSLLQIMGIVTAVHHVGYNWSAFIKARGTTWPIAVAAVIGSAVMIAVGIPLMYSDGLVGLGYGFAIGEAVNLVVRSFFVARFFGGFQLMPHLLRAFVPALISAATVLGLRGLFGYEQSLLAAVAVFAVYVALTVGSTLAVDGALLREAVSYMVRRRPQMA